MRKALLSVVQVCLLAGTLVAQQAGAYRSGDIYEISGKIADITRDQVWPGYDFRNYTRTNRDAAGGTLSFSSNFEEKGEDVFTWKLVDDYFATHGLEDDLVITFHEAFHAFERDKKRTGKPWGFENSMLIFEYQESSARTNAIFAIESRILKQALLAKKTSDSEKLTRQFLAVRKLRQSEMDPRFTDFEKGAELNEGLAEYAGTKAVALGISSNAKHAMGIPFVFRTVESFLADKYRDLDAIASVGQNIRRKFYLTGSAQGFLLDRLSPKWKQKVQMEGASVQDLLADAVGGMPGSWEIETILNRAGYEKVLRDEEQAVQKRQADHEQLLATTLAKKGSRYVIDYSSLTKPGGIRYFDPMNVTLVTQKLRVHTRSVSFQSAGSYTANFSQPVVEDIGNKRYTTVVPDGVVVKLSIDGNSFDPDKIVGRRAFATIKIETENFSLEASNGSIEMTDGNVVIKLFDR